MTTSTKSKPTIEFYSFLQSIYDFFNNRLFNDLLPSVIFTITRKKNTAGYFRPDGWLTEDGEKVHEIAINPQYFITSSPLELAQTIAHEQSHLWQHEHGKPSRRNYHNTEWAEKMKSIGLIPVSENGKGTGQKVSDKVQIGGKFEKACFDFFSSGYRLGLVDRQYNNEQTLKALNKTIEDRIKNEQPLGALSDFNFKLAKPLSDQLGVSTNIPETEDGIDLSQPISELYNIDMPEDTKPTYSTKTTYKCPNCGFKVWGAFGLPIGCTDCNTTLLIIKE